MDEGTAIIATEALKPFSEFINALLAPKVKRIKNWAIKSDAQDKLKDLQFYELMECYLKNLLHRVSGVTTLAFPLVVLPLTTIYEPLTLCEKNVMQDYQLMLRKTSNFREDIEQTITIGKNSFSLGCNYLIVDAAGMGKSTFVKNLVLEVFNHKDYIPIFLELRRINEKESLITKIATEIDDNHHFIDENLVELLLQEGGYIIVLDGYDEIPDSYRNRIGEELFDLVLKFDNNIIILTSRPGENIPRQVFNQTFSIEPLTIEQAQSLVLRYDKVANIEVGKNLINQFYRVSDDFLKNPLMVVLLYRTYSFNNSIEVKVTDFYEEIYNALYKGHDLTKIGFRREKLSNLDSVDFRRLLRGFCFLLLLLQKNYLKNEFEAIEVIEDAIKLTNMNPSSAKLYFEDLLLAVPFIIKDGTEYKFLHKSFVEFFAAEYLSYCTRSAEIVKFFHNKAKFLSFSNTFEYLSEINPYLFRAMIIAPIAKNVMLNFEKINNPYLQTACYLLGLKICLLNYEMNENYLSNIRDIEEVSKHSLRSMPLEYFHGTINEKKFVIVLVCTKQRMISKTIWQQIGIEWVYKESYYKPEHPSNNFNGIEEFVEEGKWMSLCDNTILSNAFHPFIEILFKSLPSIFEHEIKYVFELNACRNIVKKVLDESTTKNWIKTYLKNKNNE